MITLKIVALYVIKATLIYFTQKDGQEISQTRIKILRKKKVITEQPIRISELLRRASFLMGGR